MGLGSGPVSLADDKSASVMVCPLRGRDVEEPDKIFQMTQKTAVSGADSARSPWPKRRRGPHGVEQIGDDAEKHQVMGSLSPLRLVDQGLISRHD
jgi:hypothetical protein